MSIWKIFTYFYSLLCCAAFVNAGENFPTCAGPAMGTTYRFTLAAPIPEKSLGEVHREIDLLLQQIDASLSTWRDDSLVTQLNQAAAYAPIELDYHLTNTLTIAAQLCEQTQGQFDITAAPLIHWWHQSNTADSTLNKLNPLAAPADVMNLIGFKNLRIKKSTNSEYPLVQKTHADVAIDLSGIGAGYAVDQIGEYLVSLGSSSHLVELGGEVRAWGQPSPSGKWLVTIREAENTPS
ncbi:MAG: FAD:protein FMN transferase, partial [Pirellulales bacterium]|nr:FAD:protein FMN transferase [Pirellulales bacterium]